MLLCTTVFPGTPACMYLHLYNYKYLYFCQQKYKLQKIYLKVLAQPPFPWLASCFALLELSMCTIYPCMCTIYSTAIYIPVDNIFMCTIYSCAQHIHVHNIFHCTIIFLCTIYSCAQHIHIHNIFHCTIIFLCTIYSCAQYIAQHICSWMLATVRSNWFPLHLVNLSILGTSLCFHTIENNS